MKRLIVLFMFLASSVFSDEVLTRDERIVALTILGEARGEGKRGMEAVGCVIQKRMDEGNTLTPAQVCLEPWQFSIWNAGRGKVKKESELHYLWGSPSMKEAREIARKVCRHGMNQKLTGGANHFCTLEKKPYWAFDKEAKRWIKPTKIIGNHKFFKLK
jgi:spore germination cell wall hydrolase CwlJ-like protein